MATTIIIRGIWKRIIFFDDKDRGMFRWACSLLPHHMANDLRTFERCGQALTYEFSAHSVTVTMDCWQWTAPQIASFLCMVYDSYYRRRYRCYGKQCEYRVDTK